MRVAVAFDHRGVSLRDRVLAEVEALGHEAVDLGTDGPEPVCHDHYMAHRVSHDDMNVLCPGSEIIGVQVASEVVNAFLAAQFDGGERYRRRLSKVEAIEAHE